MPLAADLRRECATHGTYAAHSVGEGDDAQVYDMGCPRCADERAAKTNRPRAEAAEQAQRAAKLRRLTDEAAIPPRFADATIDAYEAPTEAMARIKAICQHYARTWPRQLGTGGSLVLTGMPGTGKTHLACAIGMAAMREHGAITVYGTLSAFARQVRATFGRNSEASEARVLKDLIEPELLIVDEIGTEGGTDFEMRILFELIDGRYRHLKPMILISNLTQQKLQDYLGSRMMDRFDEMGVVLAMDWTSYRKTARARA